MVRETRHLWVGNLPDNIREDRIREHFKRYGRVQNVKLLGRAESAAAGAGAVTTTPSTGGVGICATVAFMDIKSASKAHNAEHVLDERTLTTEYYEPAAIPTASAGAPSAGSSPAGSGYSGSSSSVNSAPGPATSSRYQLSGGEESNGTSCLAAAAAAAAAAVVATAAAPANWRGTNDSATDFCRRSNTPAGYTRYQRNNSAPYSTPPPSNVDRTPLSRWYTSGERGGGESTPSTPGAPEASVRRRRRSGSGGSSRSDTSSPDPSDESRASTPANSAPSLTASSTPHHNHNHRNSHSHQWSSSTASGRPLAICVRNLPSRSTDSSLKDGLYHEYKKHGKVVWVKVVGQNADRYAIVRFKKPSDVEKALEVSQDKLFFGCKISVAPHQSCDEEAESVKPYETDIDEYHPKATRTLFIGNLEKDVTQQQLRDKFKHFGRIIEIDIKKGSGGGAGYAFCQYASISSVVEAIRAMDGEYVGSSRVKLGFGKPVATTCVWVDGLTEHTEKQVLGAVSRCGAATSVCVDRAAGAALVHFEQAAAASAAVRELRRVAAHASAADPDHPRLCVDYASRECQEAFYEQLEKHGGSAALAGTERLVGDLASRYVPPVRHESIRYETTAGAGRARAASYSRSASRTPRYAAPEPYEPADYDRRYRVYDELGSSPPAEEAPYEERLPAALASPPPRRRHRRDSSPDEHKHSNKEWHRSVVGTSGGVVCTVSGRHRSRSGSRRRHRRRRDDSASRGATPLRDEPPDAPPAEPRRQTAPRDRSVPMMLPLPRFALELRAAPPPPPPPPAAPVAPASPARPPERPPSASSSSASSAPHSPAAELEERIRSLDEKYERWSRLDPPTTPGGSCGAAAARSRHRLLELDINEVKPSDVVRSLLAKRSVFDEDSERLQRPPSPADALRPPPPRALQYPFPSHDAAPAPAPAPATDDERASSTTRFDVSDRTSVLSDLKSNRTDFKSTLSDKLIKVDSDHRTESRFRLRTPSTEQKSQRANEQNERSYPSEEREADIDRLRSLSAKTRTDCETEVKLEVFSKEMTRDETDHKCKPSDSVKNDEVPKPETALDVFEIKTEVSRPETPKQELEECPNTPVEKPSQIEKLLSPKSEKDHDSSEQSAEKSSLPLLFSPKSNKDTEENPTRNLFSSKNQREVDEPPRPPEKSSISILYEIKTQRQNLECYQRPSASSSSQISLFSSKRKGGEGVEKEKAPTPKTSAESPPVKTEPIFESKKSRPPSPKEEASQTQKHAKSAELSKLELEINDEINKMSQLEPMSTESFLASIPRPEEPKPRAEKVKEVTKEQVVTQYKEFIDKKITTSIVNHVKEMPSKDFTPQNMEFNRCFPNVIERPKDKIIHSKVSIESRHSERESKTDYSEKTHQGATINHIADKSQQSKNFDDFKIERERSKTTKERNDKDRNESDKVKSSRHEKERHSEKVDKEKRNSVDESAKKTLFEKIDKVKTDKDKSEKEIHSKSDRDTEKSHKERSDRDDKAKHHEEKSSRHDHYRKDKRKETDEKLDKTKKDDKHKHDRHRKEHGESKKDLKKESDAKSRKSSRDESSRDFARKDSTDSSTSRASYDSTNRAKDIDNHELKDDLKLKNKTAADYVNRIKQEKESPPKVVHPDEVIVKIKTEIKEEKIDHKNKQDYASESFSKTKLELIDKHRHYSLDSRNVENKRKERINSCSSLPSHIGHKRRVSSQDSLDLFSDDSKKVKSEPKAPERRDSKEGRSTDRHKTTKFSKGHFAKIIENKTKEDKKNHVKPPDDLSDIKVETKEQKYDKLKTIKKSPKHEHEEITFCNSEVKPEGLQNDLDFLATLQLRSSEEDEKQRALRKEMKEKKRIQQLQQIQELQMQQDALQLQQAEPGKAAAAGPTPAPAPGAAPARDDKRPRGPDERRKDAAREKRMSTDRKSRDEKIEKRKNPTKKVHSSDSSDSDEPKKHSIFDIVDDGPTYISMYDKVKARSCKNMQKQEEEKRQEKIKAKFCQLKQSRAKREEKKRYSWDEDSDSDPDRKHTQKTSTSSSEDDQNAVHNRNREKYSGISFDSDRSLTNEFFVTRNDNLDESRKPPARKNSRSRIMSDTSDEEALKRSMNKMSQICQRHSDSESLPTESQTSDLFRKASGSLEMPTKEVSSDRIKKNSLLNLFGKSDSDDSKIKLGSGENENDYKSRFFKNITDFSSENESVSSNIYGENRRKHKKKQKRNKFGLPEEEMKSNVAESLETVADSKHKHSDKSRRHPNKKEKRRDRVRDSLDTDESREPRKNKIPIATTDTNSDIMSHSVKKDGKMVDIFGPLSDDSDNASRNEKVASNEFKHNFESSFDITAKNFDDLKKDKDEMKRKRDKRRKEKERRHIKEDENSLDVDAVSKAIEARLFAETDDDSRPKMEPLTECHPKQDQSIFKYTDENAVFGRNNLDSLNSDKIKRDGKEKKKKKKRSKEDRQNRKDHHINRFDHYQKHENSVIDITQKDMPDKENLGHLESNSRNTIDQQDISSAGESPSLPRITDSPPTLPTHDTSDKNKSSDLSDRLTIDESMEISEIDSEIKSQDVAIEETKLETVTPTISTQEVVESDKSSFGTDLEQNISENAVRSIPNVNEANQSINILEPPTTKHEDKVEEKPRAVISQEETADAVAALLGESFGGNDTAFSFDEIDDTSSQDARNSSMESENIPEADAEEMRQAVQNLNASEMEMKPDTPLSDNDLLLIDTDTEEADETPPDAIEKLPINIIATNPSLNATPTTSTSAKPIEVASDVAMKSIENKELPILNVDIKDAQPEKPSEVNFNLLPAKRESTSTATPVITSWTLTNHKLREPHLVNITKNPLPTKDTAKPAHVTANIIQLKAPANHNLPNSASTLRPIIGAPTRMGTQFQVINQVIRAQVPNMQPPTIKIPEQHILYQKQQGIVISPRMSNDPRLHSPKGSQSEGMTSPRLTNMTILSPSAQTLNVGLSSPTGMQQRSPGHVTVVRMQQPPLSPIQALHVPHGAHALMSPRPNSVLVQTQGGTPIHFNRLPVASVLAPISKQYNPNNLLQQGKPINLLNSPTQQHKNSDVKKIEQKTSPETASDPPKIFFSSSSLQHSTNPTVMAQNRLISMQNAIHVSNVNSPLQMQNKVLLSSLNSADRRDNHNFPYKEIKKTEHHNHLPYSSASIVHVAGVNHSAGQLMQANAKAMCNPHENTREGPNGPNVIHSLHSPRLMSTASLQNMIQIDANKGSPSVLSMSTVRAPTVLAKVNSSSTGAVTTSSLSNVVMTPLLLKTGTPLNAVRLNKTEDTNCDKHVLMTPNHIRESPEAREPALKQLSTPYDAIDRRKELLIMPAKHIHSVEHITKCETDFEELLKDNTNEIKVTNNPDKKLEINVGKNVTLVKAHLQNRDPSSILTAPSTNVAVNMLSEKKENPEVLSVNTKINESTHEEVTAKRETEGPCPSDSDKQNNPVPPTNTPPSSSSTQIRDQLNSLNSNSNMVTTMKPIASDMDSDLTKHNDESDSWSAKDVNIESVIKKVDSLCNDSTDTDENSKDHTFNVKDASQNITSDSTKSANSLDTSTDEGMDQSSSSFSKELSDKAPNTNKRGGRGGVRGKKIGKNPDRVQTRQISKPARGTGPKRGRGRVNADKKSKGAINSSPSNLPGDVYDFHEDSGDDDSPNKNEPRPRLILTIKSPLAGQTTAVSTASLTTAPKDQIKLVEKPSLVPLAVAPNKEDKPEDFASPSANTRKSRRLQEKDVQRNVEDEDPVKGPPRTKDNKRRLTRQVGAKIHYQEKLGADARKSPRGVKRTRDRSISDASIDSSDEKTKKDEAPKEAKLPKMVELHEASLPTPAPPPVSAPVPISAPAPAPAPAPKPLVLPTPSLRPDSEPQPLVPFKPNTPIIAVPSSIPTPITKPPKKMISEISAKLASVFEAAASSVPPLRTTNSPIVPDKLVQNDASSRVGAEADEPMMGAKHGLEEDMMAAATAEARPDAVYRNALPVGALEAADARVQSPALPHRPPSLPNAHRPTDRATPVLIRAGEGASGYRAAYAGTASLPRGAHHPPPPPPPQHPALAAGLVPLHHRPHPGSTARMTATVPHISPQGQIGLHTEVRSPPPAHQQTSPVTPGDGIYPHFSHQQYQLYQQHFRATQHEARASPSPYTRSLEAEGSEAPAPPLELRRPPSARVPRPAHSPAPNDRLIMYGVVGGRSPPPAHATRPPSALPPPAPPGPSHASQVPREADSLQMLLRRYPVMWQGLLALKNDSAAVQMHFVGGNPGVAGGTLPRHTDGSTPPLRVAQRMRLEPAQLDQVHRKMKLENEHCMLLALPCGRDHMDVLQQSTNLTHGFITYLQRKQAAGIVNVAPPGHHQAMYTVHIFPSCDFANENLNRIAPDLMHRVADIAHLLIVIATV